VVDQIDLLVSTRAMAACERRLDLNLGVEGLRT
jgi:hypothetical protein